MEGSETARARASRYHVADCAYRKSDGETAAEATGKSTDQGGV